MICSLKSHRIDLKKLFLWWYTFYYTSKPTSIRGVNNLSLHWYSKINADIHLAMYSRLLLCFPRLFIPIIIFALLIFSISLFPLPLLI